MYRVGKYFMLHKQQKDGITNNMDGATVFFYRWNPKKERPFILLDRNHKQTFLTTWILELSVQPFFSR